MNKEKIFKTFFDFSKDCFFDGCKELRKDYANEMNSSNAPCCGGRKHIKEKYKEKILKKLSDASKEKI